LVLAACSASRDSTGAPLSSPVVTSSGGTSRGTAPAPSTSSAAATPTRSAAPGAPVHVSLLQGDGGVYGIGIPIVAYVDRKVSDATAFEQATTVTVNGAPAAGAWYWQRSGRDGQVLEAHYRTRAYWPAHAKINVVLPVKGLSAGPGLTFENSLTLSIATGPAHVSSVDCRAEKLTVTSDGKHVRTLPTSCGKAKTPTFTGTKVVMQKGENVPGSSRLRPNGTVRFIGSDPADPYDLLVPWSVRLTNSGEYVHSASWNGGNIGIRSTSNGCTNLTVTDAEWFYRFAAIGDVVTYTNTGGKPMPSWDGLGDWNLAWSTWQDGGVVPSSN